jgi:Ferroportin1 (FPN1)
MSWHGGVYHALADHASKLHNTVRCKLTSHLTSRICVLCSESDNTAVFGKHHPQQQPNSTAAEQPNRQPPEQQRSSLLRRTFSGWRVYLQQPVLPAALSLALLYLTVMSLGKLLRAG